MLWYLISCFLYFVCVGIDVTMFFLQVRLVLLWNNIGWLVPFDNAGVSLVSAITSKVPLVMSTDKQLSEKGKLFVALAVFTVARIVLGVILRSA